MYSCGGDEKRRRKKRKILDPAGSTVRYEMMNLCNESVWYSNGWYLVVLTYYKVVLVNS